METTNALGCCFAEYVDVLDGFLRYVQILHNSMWPGEQKAIFHETDFMISLFYQSVNKHTQFLGTEMKQRYSLPATPPTSKHTLCTYLSPPLCPTSFSMH